MYKSVNSSFMARAAHQLRTQASIGIRYSQEARGVSPASLVSYRSSNIVNSSINSINTVGTFLTGVSSSMSSALSQAAAKCQASVALLESMLVNSKDVATREILSWNGIVFNSTLKKRRSKIKKHKLKKRRKGLRFNSKLSRQ